jgi:hypothetical protein
MDNIENLDAEGLLDEAAAYVGNDDYANAERYYTLAALKYNSAEA